MYFIATYKRPFGSLLPNKLKLKLKYSSPVDASAPSAPLNWLRLRYKKLSCCKKPHHVLSNFAPSDTLLFVRLINLHLRYIALQFCDINGFPTFPVVI